MKALELKIPPPAVLLVIGAAMWAVSGASLPLGLSEPARIFGAMALAVAGAGIDLFGLVSFLRARTTINPMKPDRTTALVTTGAYRFSRNPMYVGQVIVLLGWAVFLNSAWALAGPFVFVLYINRLQIVPEERVLAAAFGNSYSAYKSSVRRWL